MGNKVVIEAELATKSFEKQIEEVERQLKEIDYELSHAKELKLDSRTIKEYELKAEKLTNQLVVLKKKQEDLNKSNLSGISTQLNNIGNGVQGVIKKVTKWGLAVFSIRSAYNFIRGSIRSVSEHNEQLAADVEYIRFALASTLQPVIERIIQLAYTLLQYVGYIAKAWFGVNIFANASTKAFQKNNKALSGSVKQAKELNKQLAGFDEMNVLQDNTNASGSASSGGGVVTPSIDLSEIESVDFSGVGKWLDKLKEFILKGFDGIVKNVKKVMKNLGFSEDMIEAWTFFIGGVRNMLKGLLDFIIGILKMILGLFSGNTELLKEGFKQTINGIGSFLKGALQTFIGIITMTLAVIIDLFKSLWGGIVNGAKGAINGIKNFFNSIPSFFSGIVKKITGFFKNIGSAAGNVIASAFKSVVNGVLRTIENILNTPIRTINSLISTINKISPVKIGRLSTFSLPRLAKGGIVNMPGRGINYGGANIAERAPEAVIPFTDEQVMDRLGQSIARHMVINATITNTMNGRVISREIQRVQNNSNFAMNR
jgi:phage-related protein